MSFRVIHSFLVTSRKIFRTSFPGTRATPLNFLKMFYKPKPLLNASVRPCRIVAAARWHQSRKFNGFYPGLFCVWSLSFPLFSKEEKEEEEKEPEVIKTMKLAILANQRGEMAKAEQLLHLALKMAQEKDEVQTITYIYDLMANFALQNEEFKKAETLFVDVLKRFLGGGMDDSDNAVVDVSLKLANIYSNLGDLEKACQGFQFCIETQEAKLKAAGEENVDEDTMVLWAMSHDWFARFLLDLGHYERAKGHFLRAHEVCIKVKGPEDPQTAVLLNDLGSVCSLLQDYENAISYLEEAIRVGKLCNSEDLASFYVNLGTVYLQMKVFKSAEKFCKKGMRVAKAYKNKEAESESVVCLDTLKEIRS